MADLLTDVRTILVTTPVRWEGLTKALSPVQLSERPAAEEWSAVECLQHMLDTEHVFQTRLLAFLDGRDFEAFDPDKEGTLTSATMDPAQLAAEFAKLRADSLRLLDTLTPEDYERIVRHAELGPVKLREMLAEWAAHDFNHTIQAERALMQPFIQECGPWRGYFESLVI